MAKNVFNRLFGKNNDSIPYSYGSPDEVTPVKFASVEDPVFKEPREADKSLEVPQLTGFVQRLRNSFRIKKRNNKDYNLMENRPSPFKTPPAFLREEQSQLTLEPYDSPYGLEHLQDFIDKNRKRPRKKEKKRKPAGTNLLAQEFAREELAVMPVSPAENDENGNDPDNVKPELSAHANEAYDDKLLEDYFKTPEGMRKHHRHPKILLSGAKDQLI